VKFELENRPVEGEKNSSVLLGQVLFFHIAGEDPDITKQKTHLNSDHHELPRTLTQRQ
jgi:hypothetical protein